MAFKGVRTPKKHKKIVFWEVPAPPGNQTNRRLLIPPNMTPQIRKRGLFGEALWCTDGPEGNKMYEKMYLG